MTAPTAPTALAIVNAAVMAAMALGSARLPHWSRASSWLLLLVSVLALALHVAQDAWSIDAEVLVLALLVSSGLNAAALAPLAMQGLLTREARPRRSAD